MGADTAYLLAYAVSIHITPQIRRQIRHRYELWTCWTLAGDARADRSADLAAWVPYAPPLAFLLPCLLPGPGASAVRTAHRSAQGRNRQMQYRTSHSLSNIAY
eukprot:1734093-Rhodomonas_salina.6